MKSVLSIAGSDSSGGAGIQADLKAIQAFHMFGQTAVTSLTAQNTQGVFGVYDASPEFVEQQIDVVFSDIRPDAVKIGMVSTPEIVHAIAAALKRNSARNIVVDPVMVATSGADLASNEAIAALREELIPLADIITPNMPEAQVLCGFEIESEADQERAARTLAGLFDDQAAASVSEKDVSPASIAASAGCFPKAVLVKGGHGSNDANDVLVSSGGEVSWLRGQRIDTENIHGTGCTLSSAIACGLAEGLPVEQAVRNAKDFVTGAIRYNPNLGRGNGPLNHMWRDFVLDGRG